MREILAVMAGVLSIIEQGLQRLDRDAGIYRENVEEICVSLQDVISEINRLSNMIRRSNVPKQARLDTDIESPF